MDTKCQCHLIYWSGGPGKYKIKSTGEIITAFCRFDCQRKVNEGEMEMKQYYNVCQYIPGRPGSKFPLKVYEMLLNG